MIILNWMDIKPGDMLRYIPTKTLYVVLCNGVTVDGPRIMFVHRDSYTAKSIDPESSDPSLFEKVNLHTIQSWDEVEPGDKIVCISPRDPGCTNSILEYAGDKYLESVDLLWRLDQFYESDYRLLDKGLDVKIEGEE